MTDPDYRFTLANERTLLAWLRTALALLAAGVAVVHLVPDLGLPGARRVIGTTLAGLSATVAITSMLRWRAVQAAMRRDDELPPSRAPLLLSISLAVLSLLVLVLLALRGGPGCTPRRATRVASARTLLAWERTALGLLANAALLLSRTDPARLIPAAAALVLAVIAAVIGPRRRRQIAQSPGETVPEPSLEVLVLGTGVTILGLLAILL